MNYLYRLNNKNLQNIAENCAEQLNVESSFILVPTETVYGLICSWKDEKAKARIYKAKQRPENKPFQILISNNEMLKETNAVISETTRKIIDKFCPGPITIIVPTKDNNKVGFRIPEYEFVIVLINKLGIPLAATSANISGEPAALNIQTALDSLNLPPDITVDGGNLSKDSIASTVIEIKNNNNVKLLREGPISFSEIIKSIK